VTKPDRADEAKRFVSCPSKSATGSGRSCGSAWFIDSETLSSIPTRAALTGQWGVSATVSAKIESLLMDDAVDAEAADAGIRRIAGVRVRHRLWPECVNRHPRPDDRSLDPGRPFSPCPRWCDRSRSPPGFAHTIGHGDDPEWRSTVKGIELMERLQAFDLNAEVSVQINSRAFASPVWTGIVDTAGLFDEKTGIRPVSSPWEPKAYPEPANDEQEALRNIR
jgi:hypothetical protein